MDWRFKALVHLVFSGLPYGEMMAYALQRRVSKSLPVSDDLFVSRVMMAKEHLASVRRHSRKRLSDLSFYEFGAGVDLIGPLSYYGFGVEKQILTDICTLLRPVMVNDTVERLYRFKDRLGLERTPGTPLSTNRKRAVVELEQHYGISYLSPVDPKHTGLSSGSVDVVTSHSTLEHISLQELPGILRECHRLLSHDGIASMRIDYEDHYSYFDRSIPRYNFLRYPDGVWWVFSPRLHYQNRLRHVDYLRMFRETGFEVAEDQHEIPSEAALEALARFPVTTRFHAYSDIQLLIAKARISLRKVKHAADSGATRGDWSKVNGGAMTP